MGRSNRGIKTNVSELRPEGGVLEATRSANDYLSLDTYADYGIISESLNPLDDTQYSQREFDEAYEVVKEIERVLCDREVKDKEGELQSRDLSEKGLLIAEGIYNEIADSAGGQADISEKLDPDGAFLSQDDGDHLYALAAYMRALREGSAAKGMGEGMSEARREHYADLVDSARDIAKESAV